MHFYTSRNNLFNKPLYYVFGLFLITFVFTFSSHQAQAQWDYSVTGTVKKNKKKLDGAIVTLYKGSAVVQQITTSSNGKFGFKLDQEAEYTLTITKGGHITKKFVFSTRGIPEDRAKEPFGGQDLEVSIFEMPKDPGVVSQINSILGQPMAKFFYDDKLKEIDFDKNYSQSVRDALARLQAVEEETNKKEEEDAKKNAEEAKNKAAMEAAIASKYQAAIAKGDAAFSKKDYTTARTAYTDALDIKPGEPYPKGKIIEIEKLIADAAKNAALEADYQAAIAKADAAFAAKTYDGAKTNYNAALKLKPAEAYPKTKLAEIEKLLADAAKNAELNAKYDAAIAKADKAFATKTYDAAKAGYNEALGLKAAEKYPKDKLAEIDKLLADIANKEKADKELQAKYDAAIAKADKAFAAKTYDAAKAGYNEALGIKPTEKYPKDKIAEIDKLLGDIANKEKAEKELQAKYDAAIAKADKALAAKTYDAAKAGYNEALGFKPAEQYPKDKIAELDKILAELAAKNKAEQDKLAKERELNNKYNAAITKADKALVAKTYDAAKAGYNEALGIKPAEQYPKDKIAEIDKLLANAAAEKDKIAKAAELEAKYKAAIAKADAAFKVKTYDAAKASYNEALGLKSAEQYPKDKIAEIDALIAKELGAKALDEKYNAAIAKADKAFADKTYDAAKTGYNEALGFKPAEAYPKTKLTEIDKLLADAAAKENAEKDRLAKEKELEEKYKAAIAKGDAGLKAKTYDAAKTAYNEALGIKANEKYPKDKIAEIDAILAKEMGAKAAEEKYKAAIAKGDAAMAKKDYATAKTGYTDAVGLKPGEQYPKDKLLEIDKLLADAAAEKDKLAKNAEIEAKYKAAIAKGDAGLKAKTYDAAKTAYNEALGIKANEQYPKDKIAEIDKLLTAAKEAEEKDRLAKEKELAEKNKLASAAEIEAKYKAAIAKGDAGLKAKTYDAAKTAYNEALGIKTNEQYPKDKIAEIDKLLAELANKNAAANELNEKYNAIILKADGAFGGKDYATAKATYNEALGLKPNEKYPKDKIAAIDALLAKESNAKELDEKYKAAIAKADGAFGSKDYASSKTYYNEALSLKAAETYPKEQLAKIEKIIADESKNRSAQAKYDAAIAKADEAFAAKNYTVALASYKEAQSAKPTEPYPATKISEVNKILDDIARASGKEQQYKNLIEKADKHFATKDYKQARSAYQSALILKSTEKYPKDKIAQIDKLTNNKTLVVADDRGNKDDFKSELAKKYPEGITEESATENNAKVTRRIVVRGNEGHLYIQKITSFGPIYYFKDDVPITEKEYMQDTEVVNK